MPPASMGTAVKGEMIDSWTVCASVPFLVSARSMAVPDCCANTRTARLAPGCRLTLC